MAYALKIPNVHVVNTQGSKTPFAPAHLVGHQVIEGVDPQIAQSRAAALNDMVAASGVKSVTTQGLRFGLAHAGNALEAPDVGAVIAHLRAHEPQPVEAPNAHTRVMSFLLQNAMAVLRNLPASDRAPSGLDVLHAIARVQGIDPGTKAIVDAVIAAYPRLIERAPAIPAALAARVSAIEEQLGRAANASGMLAVLNGTLASLTADDVGSGLRNGVSCAIDIVRNGLVHHVYWDVPPAGPIVGLNAVPSSLLDFLDVKSVVKEDVKGAIEGTIEGAIGGAITGGITGALAGGTAGAVVGGAATAPVGGEGAVPGAAVGATGGAAEGAAIGLIAGGVGGGVGKAVVKSLGELGGQIVHWFTGK